MHIDWVERFDIDQQARALIDTTGPSSAGAPFASTSLLEAWHRHQGRSRPVRIGRASVGGDLVGLLVLSRRADDPAHQWRLWGDTIDTAIVWCRPDHAIEAWTGWLSAMAACNECLLVRNLANADIVSAAMFAAGRAVGASMRLLDRRSAPHIDLADGYDRWLAGRTASQRRQFRRSTARFAAVPGLVVDEVCDPAVIAGAVDDGLALHLARFGAADRATMLGAEPAMRFTRAAMIALAASGSARVLRARSHGRPVAAEFLVTTDTAWFSWNGGWDPALAAHHLGTGLLLEAARRAAAAGVRRYSLLEGDEPYKARLCNGRRQLSSWLVEPAADPGPGSRS